MDTVDFGQVFAFSGVDIFTKEADVILRPSLTSYDGLVFLETAMERRFDGFVDLIQTDGGPEFKDEFVAHVLKYTGRHRIARPYKKNEQAYIEAFNRSLRKECLGWGKYKAGDIPVLTKEVENWLSYDCCGRLHEYQKDKIAGETVEKETKDGKKLKVPAYSLSSVSVCKIRETGGRVHTFDTNSYVVEGELDVRLTSESIAVLGKFHPGGIHTKKFAKVFSKTEVKK